MTKNAKIGKKSGVVSKVVNKIQIWGETKTVNKLNQSKPSHLWPLYFIYMIITLSVKIHHLVKQSAASMTFHWVVKQQIAKIM